jgi:hypothetical protein
VTTFDPRQVRDASGISGAIVEIAPQAGSAVGCD